eukprot:2690951-Rhodomonas_salina.1
MSIVLQPELEALEGSGCPKFWNETLDPALLGAFMNNKLSFISNIVRVKALFKFEGCQDLLKPEAKPLPHSLVLPKDLKVLDGSCFNLVFHNNL